MSFYSTSAAHRQSIVYDFAPPPTLDAVAESSLVRIAKLVLPILAALVALFTLPPPMGIILASAIAVGGLFFGGYLSGDAIKKVFSSIRPPRASLFNEEVNPPAPPVSLHGSFIGARPSYPRSVVTPAFVAVPPPQSFVPRPQSERKDDHAGAPRYVTPPTVSSLGAKPREREPANVEGRRPSISDSAPPPYAAAVGQQREQVNG